MRYLILKERGILIDVNGRSDYYVGVMEGLLRSMKVDYGFLSELEEGLEVVDLFMFRELEERIKIWLLPNDGLKKLWEAHKRFVLVGFERLDEGERRVILWLLSLSVIDLVRGVARVGDWRYVMGWDDLVKFGEPVYGFYEKVLKRDEVVIGLFPNIELDLDMFENDIIPTIDFRVPEDNEFPDAFKPNVLTEKDVLKKEELPEQKIIQKAVIDTREKKGKDSKVKSKPVVKKVIKKKK